MEMIVSLNTVSLYLDQEFEQQCVTSWSMENDVLSQI